MPHAEPLFRDGFEPIAALYEKAKREQWNAATDISWQDEIGLEDDLEPEAAIRLRAFRIGAQYVGEAMAVTSDFTGPTPPDREARAFLATQFIDEVRHAEVFHRYLAKLGAAPCELGNGTEILSRFFGSMQTYAESLVCAQVFFEGLGVDLFQADIDNSPCKLLETIYERVRRDEARHTAFGTLYLDRLVPTLSAAERRGLQERLDEGVRIFFSLMAESARVMPPLPVEFQGRLASQWQEVFPAAMAGAGERLRRWDLTLSLPAAA